MKRSILTFTTGFVFGVIALQFFYLKTKPDSSDTAAGASSKPARQEVNSAAASLQTGQEPEYLSRKDSIASAADMKRLIEGTDLFADGLLINGWAASNPASLRDWLSNLPESARKRGDLLYLGMMSLIKHSPSEFFELLQGKGNAFFDILDSQHQREVLAGLSAEDLNRFESLRIAQGQPKTNGALIELLRQSRVLGLISTSGFDAAFDTVSKAENAERSGEILALMKNIPDTSREAISSIYEKIHGSNWWGKDHGATLIASQELGNYAPEIAISEALKIPGAMGQSTAQTVLQKWYERDPESVLNYLPNSPAKDRNTQFNFLHAILPGTTDATIRKEIQQMIENLSSQKN